MRCADPPAVGELQRHHRRAREADQHRVICGSSSARVVVAAAAAGRRRARVRVTDSAVGGALKGRARGVLGIQAGTGKSAGPSVRRPRAPHQQCQQGAGAGVDGEHLFAAHLRRDTRTGPCSSRNDISLNAPCSVGSQGGEGALGPCTGQEGGAAGAGGTGRA